MKGKTTKNPIPLKIRYYLQTEILIKFNNQYYEVGSSSDGRYTSRLLSDAEVKEWGTDTKIRVQNI